MARGGRYSGRDAPARRNLAFAYWRPRYWPRWLRRLFLAAFPIALIGWMLVGLALLAAGIARGIWHPLGRFWNAPRRVRYRYDYYEYGTGCCPSRHDADECAAAHEPQLVAIAPEPDQKKQVA